MPGRVVQVVHDDVREGTMVVVGNRVIQPALAAAALAAAACGNGVGDVGEDGVRSGTRLRATYVGGGQARQFTGFFDQQRGEPCAFETKPRQNDAYCLPAGERSSGDFLDPACTRPALAVRVGACEPAPTYLTVPPDVCGAEVTRIWELGAPIHVPMIYRFHDDLSTCAGIAQPDDAMWRPGITEVPLRDFAHARMGITAEGPRLRTLYVEGDDGSRQDLGALDTELGIDCKLTAEYIDLGLTCHPRICAFGSGWADASCTVPLVRFDASQDPTCVCGPSHYAWVTTQSAIGEGIPRVFKIGPPAETPASVYTVGFLDATRVCQRNGVTAGDMFTTSGEVEVALAGRTMLAGGRLRPVVIAGDGARVPDGFHDTALGFDCTPMRARDQVRRCLPGGGPVGPFYLDAACTTPVTASEVWVHDGVRRSAQGKPLAMVATTDDYSEASACEPVRTVYELGERLSPGQLYTDVSTTCRPYVWDPTFSEVHLVVQALPSDRFVEMSEFTE